MESGRARAVGAGASLALVGLALAAWWGLFGVGAGGEEHAIVARIARGEASTHVFRPLADALLFAVARVSPDEFLSLGHALVLALHVAAAALLQRIARGLGAPPAGAWLAAALFVVGGGIVDSMAWLAAVNRPASALGALACFAGLVRYARPASSGGGRAPDLVLAAAGFAWQYLSNEEVYGTAAVAAVWLAARAPLRLPSRLALAAVPIVAVAVHFFLLSGAARGAAQAGHLRAADVVDNALARHAAIGAGFGLSPWLTFAVLVAAVVALVASRRTAIAVFGVLALGGALVPFVLDAPMPYRHHPTQAPFALLVGVTIGCALARARVAAVAVPVVAVLALLAGASARGERIEAWRAAHVPHRALDAALRERTPGALLGLDATVRAVLEHRLGVEAAASVPSLGFLDAPSGAAPGPDALEALDRAWFGRRADGTLGWIEEPPEYLAARATLPEALLVADAIAAESRVHAAALVADPSIDLARTAVLEGGHLPAIAAPPLAPDEGVLSTERLPPLEGRRRLAVDYRAHHDRWLVLHPPWLFHWLVRYSEDAALAQGIREPRTLVPSATDANGNALEVRRANVHGVAVRVPAGGGRIEVTWRIATAAEVR